jgi:hypothetical protein
MRSHFKKIKKTKINEDCRPRLQKEIEEPLDEMLEIISLKNMPFEERRKEAQKPLFLIRYE